MCKKIVSIIMCLCMMCSVLSGEYVMADDVSSTETPISTITPTEDPAIVFDDKILVKDIDYTLTYRDNTNVGTAAIIVTFIGNYAGQREVNFNIINKQSSGSSRRKKTNIHISQDDKLIMETNTNGKVHVVLPIDIQYNSVYKVYVETNGIAKVNEDVEIQDGQGRILRGRTDKNGIAYLTVVSDPTRTPEPSPTATQDSTVSDIHTPYIVGYEDDTFRPDAFLTRAETASMLSKIFDVKVTEQHAKFPDVSNSAWYNKVIEKMAASGIINGYTDGTFRPENNITRAEFITMLMQNENVRKFETLPFSDITSQLWSADYIYSAYRTGYIDGYADGTFKPDNFITRAEAVKIVNAVLKRTDLKIVKNPFDDVTETHWAYKEILEAAVEHTN